MSSTGELPVVECCYVYAHLIDSGDPPGLVFTGTVGLLDDVVADYSVEPWTVDSYGTYVCGTPVPPYEPPTGELPPPSTGPLPPSEEPPASGGGGGGNVDENTIIIQLITNLITVMENCCPSSSSSSNGGNAAQALVYLKAIATSLSTIVTKITTFPKPNTDPVTCAQLTGLWEQLIATLNGTPLPPMPEFQTPPVYAAAPYTALDAQADIESAILVLSNLYTPIGTQ